MTSLYKLSEDFIAAMNNMDAMLANTEIDAETYADTLESLTGELEDKVLNVGMHIKNVRSDIEQLKQAKAEMDARIMQKEKGLDFYTGYLDQHMKLHNMQKAENEYCVIKYRNLPATVELNGQPIPGEYLAIPEPPAPRPMKREILAALKNGETITGAELITGKTKLEIK